MKFKKVVALATVVASMAVMSQAAFADNVLRCHQGATNVKRDCIEDQNNTGTGSYKIEYYERGTGNSTGYFKVERG